MFSLLALLRASFYKEYYNNVTRKKHTQVPAALAEVIEQEDRRWEGKVEKKKSSNTATFGGVHQATAASSRVSTHNRALFSRVPQQASLPAAEPVACMP